MSLPTSPKGLPTSPRVASPPQPFEEHVDDWGSEIDDPITAPSVQSVIGNRKVSDAPQAASTDATEVIKYLSVGQLTPEQLLHGPDLYTPLGDKILTVTEYVQDLLKNEGITDRITLARDGDDTIKAEVAQIIDRMILEYINKGTDIPRGEERKFIIAAVSNEILGLGPLEPLWGDPRITEIAANGPFDIQVEIGGRMVKVPGAKFRDREHLLSLCQTILRHSDRRVDKSKPIADGRLPDLSRVSVVHPSIAPAGPNLTIRRHGKQVWTIKDLIKLGSFNEDMAVDMSWLIHSGCSTIVVGGTGAGKALDVDTLIPTPLGMVRMGDLQVGSTVLDNHGNPTKVTGVFDQEPNRECYRVTFSDGTHVIADADHLWVTSTRASRAAYLKRITKGAHDTTALSPDEVETLNSLLLSATDTLSVPDITATLPRLRDLAYRVARTLQAQSVGPRSKMFYAKSDLVNGIIAQSNRLTLARNLETTVTTRHIKATLKVNGGQSNHAVRLVSKPTEFQSPSVPLNPRAVGRYLARPQAGRAEDGAITADQAIDAGLHGADANPLVDSIIPEAYLHASVHDRKELLHGVLQERGKLSQHTGNTRVETQSQGLALSLQSLISSLGCQARVTQREVAEPGTTPTYRVSFYWSTDQECSPRTENDINSLRRSNLRYIVSVDPVDSVPVRCISVDSPDSMFLCTENYIPTHNTTVLNALSGLFPLDARIITIEDNLELQLHPDRLSAAPMEARDAGASGSGSITIRDLVKASLRMRPDRIIVGEVRDSAAFDMLQAMNTGHAGSMTTIHANGAEEAIPRLESMVSQSGELDARGALALIAGAVDLLVILERFPEDGSRRVTGIYEVPSRVSDGSGGNFSLPPVPLWEFEHTSTDPETGRVIGDWVKKNDPSPDLRRKHRLDRREKMNIEQIFEMSRL